MPTLPNMGMITPTVGADSGSWDDKINACFVQVDEHDHTSGKGVLVPVAGLDIDADFAMGGNAVTGLGSIAFNAVTALSAGSKRLFVSSSDNELYWRTNAGTNVKLTDGTSINTTLVGGIVGDYSSVGASVSYEDSNKRYKLLTQTATWARLATGPVRIYEYNTSESVYVEHAVAAALAASYTVTWPAALPGSTAVVQISSAGAVSFSNTIVNDVTMTVDKSITVSGTGDYKHGEKIETMAIPFGAHVAGGVATRTFAASVFTWSLPAGCVMYVPFARLRAGWRLKRVYVYGESASAGGLELECQRLLVNQSGPDVTTTTGDYTSGSCTATLDTPYTAVEGDVLYVIIIAGASDITSLTSVSLVYDIP